MYASNIITLLASNKGATENSYRWLKRPFLCVLWLYLIATYGC